MDTRTLGVDVGSVRTGLAVSDPAGVLATPVGVLDGRGEPSELADRVAAAAREHGCGVVVVGLPRGMSGRDTASTSHARAVARALEGRGLRVHLWDERLSSAEADRVLAASGRRSGTRRGVRDQVAATIILQSWLEAHRARE